ncbi:general substrate transporter [Ampelomyces quisqualis]|uniref:General substrate transporter n=1 Tax=Ampelomyces quisqualis TaxID=50730 RepID=A0A6A5R355_AMPQU|nr:general substrate transporter [Ampelomyces quisqualis]
MTDAAAEPLISSNRGYPHDARHGEDSAEDVEADESALVSPGLFIWGLTICAGVSGLLFGYDTGVISSTLISIDTSLSHRSLTTLDKSLITSSTSFFALLASPLTGILADALGRRSIILIADILFVAGALIQAFSTTVSGMIVGRSVVGAAVGSASFVVPMYISELAPSAFRGRLVTVSSLFITGGQVVAYTVGWIFSTRAHGWRWMVGLGALPAAIQFCLLFALPETPRYLVKVGRKEHARRVLRKVYGKGEGMEALVNGVLRRVDKEIREEEEAADDRNVAQAAKTSWKAKFSRVNDKFLQLVNVGGNRRALIIACMLQGFQQLCGFNSLMYFSATIFRLLGFSSPTLTSLSIALTNLAFTLVAFHAIDRLGRRRILLSSIPVMLLALLLSATAFHFLALPPAATAPEHASTHPPQHLAAPPRPFWLVVILLALMLYVAGYAVGLGTVPWQQAELFPLAVRSLGSALATATNWAGNTLVGLTFLPMMDVLTPTGTFAVYAGVCVVAWGCVWRVYPETAGLGLEDVARLLARGWGVGESVEGFEARRRRSGALR